VNREAVSSLFAGCGLLVLAAYVMRWRRPPAGWVWRRNNHFWDALGGGSTAASDGARPLNKVFVPFLWLWKKYRDLLRLRRYQVFSTTLFGVSIALIRILVVISGILKLRS
jgi:hypothetical protein